MKFQKMLLLRFLFLFTLPFLCGNYIYGQVEATLDRITICEGECTEWAPTITAGNPPFSYLWSTGDTDSLIVLCPESSLFYDLTITDANNDFIQLNNSVIVGPTSRSPIPTITTPICTGETAYLFHPNYGSSPIYYWSGPNGFESNEQNPIIENISPNHAGEYKLVIKYYDLCTTDTVSLFLEVNDLKSQSSCEALSRCNIACGIFDILALGGDVSLEPSPGIQPPNLCGDENEIPNNIQWIGFVAQPGDHTLKLKARNCENNGAGLRFGIYDNCDFSNLIKCTNECSVETFEIESSLLTPGVTYYIYAEGCGENECNFTFSSEGSMQSIYCNDYVPFDNTSNWHFSFGSFSSSGSFWMNYQGDTTINNQTYRKIGIDDDEFNTFRLLLREDAIERKVYNYSVNDGMEKILYDFSLSVGDVFFEPTYDIRYEVKEIDIVASHFGPIKRWTFENDFGSRFSYREAVGSSYLAIPAVDAVISDPVYSLIGAFNQCEPIIGSLDSINAPGSSFDTLLVGICEGEDYEGLTVEGIYSDTTHILGSCIEVSTINLEVLDSNDPDCFTGTNNFESNSLSIYPNPSPDNIFIEDKNPFSGVRIFNNEMKLIKEISYNEVRRATIGISDFDSGLYFFSILSKDQKTIKKIIKS